MPARRSWLVVFVLASLAGCRGCKSCEPDEELEEQEERAAQRDLFWRAQIVIVGQGRVKSVVDAFDCASDGSSQSGQCGPRLVRFKELAPPLMEARPAPGWRLARWDAIIRTPDGGSRGRVGPMPDGRMYLDGFGYSDTGELETVTAVFEPEGDAHDGVHP